MYRPKAKAVQIQTGSALLLLWLHNFCKGNRYHSGMLKHIKQNLKTKPHNDIIKPKLRGRIVSKSIGFQVWNWLSGLGRKAVN